MTEEIFAYTTKTESVVCMSWKIENFLDILRSQGSSISGPDVIMPTQPKTIWKTFIDEEEGSDFPSYVNYVFRAEPLKFPELKEKFEIQYVLSFQDRNTYPHPALQKFKGAVYSYSSCYVVKEKFSVRYSNFVDEEDVSNFLTSEGALNFKCCFRVVGCSTDCFVTPENDIICLLDNFRALHSSKTFTDFTIVVENKMIPVHKCILASRSPVFAAMFKSETLEMLDNQLVIEDFDFKTMETFILYLYTSQLDECAAEEYFQLHSISDKYALESLKKTCAHKLIDCIDVSNVCDVFSSGYYHNDAVLKTAAKAFIISNRSSVLASENWRKKNSQDNVLAAEIQKETGLKMMY